ncbi:ABC transporter permease [Bradyrhizobium sp. U87765 SZCCT0131]|nr:MULTISPECIES: ABC transporter permease [unclassified Bradyrhizobium]MBR1218000.1 ABC transporter permease [Bradyrhizobium sp. U87765 SZCCT0131]MBR1261054.1 ABC transporter permease [Bradyrhizobium sp. U87765 SZCCT0134]MBR1303498.1 ABC transporter permease [Bradyrhizobium sp. U87765 SZCCT0110]MBR1319104.1 ABC transporter permease [Bradyrhizobium sp. U87765 SZCCT0109]MBR1347429.1 ABC transporter permease [Bradyrhizobium sp. U87765 SZCCT0048]
MTDLMAIPPALLYGQLLVGLINGSFYAMMSLGVAVIFGMLRIGNFVHGAQYMLGAFAAWYLLNLPELFPSLDLPAVGYWWALVIVPLVVAAVGALMERLFIRRIYDLDHAYGLLLTVGLAMIIEGLFNVRYGAAGQQYDVPDSLKGAVDLGFMMLPYYRAWVVAAALILCFGTWYLIERTKLGSYLRAATENPELVRAFGINVPRMLMLTYAFGVGLAGLTGVMAAPIYQVGPQMGQSIIITTFAVVVIGGMGSILGAIASGLMMGLAEGLTKVFYPQASTTVIFVIMAVILILRPAGLFGKDTAVHSVADVSSGRAGSILENGPLWFGVLLVVGVVLPYLIFPILAMKILCFALFAMAYNLIFGYVGLLAFGHAAFFGASSYITAQSAAVWGLRPELCVLLGVSASTVIGVLFGWLAIRRQGLYFAMITLALAQIVYFYALQTGWTHGEDGIQSVPRGMLFGLVDLGNSTNIYFVTLAVFLAAFAFIYRIVHSPFGLTLKSIRENPARSTSLGYSTDHFKLIAFTLSAMLSGLAGGLKAIVFQIASLADLHFGASADVLLMTLIGGVGTLLGPVVGAAVLVTLQTKFATSGAWVVVIQGAIFVLCVLFLRKGIIGTLEEILANRGVRRAGGGLESVSPSKESPAEAAR